MENESFESSSTEGTSKFRRLAEEREAAVRAELFQREARDVFRALKPLGQAIEEIGVDAYVEQILRRSKFERTPLLGGGEMIENREGEKYVLKLIENPDDPVITKVHRMLLETFNPEEVCGEDELRDGIRENRSPERGGDLILHVITSEEGELLAMMEGRYSSLTDERGKKYPYGAAAGGYVICKPEFRSKGFTHELFSGFFAASARAAEANGEELRYFAGECVKDVEPILNKMGWGRVYVKDQEGVLVESRYVQPPLEWNPETGEPAEGAGTAPEHLMIGAKSGEWTVPKHDLHACVRAFYDYVCYDAWPREKFLSDAAFGKSRALVKRLYDEFKAGLGNSGEPQLITRKQREAMKADGYVFREYDEADAKDWAESAVG